MSSVIPEFGDHSPGATYVLRPGGYALVFDPDRRLAVARTPQGHFLPGGGQEEGETPRQAAIREVAEECGLCITITACIGIADELVDARDENTHFRKRCTFFLARVSGRVVARNLDHELIWLPPPLAQTFLRHGSQRWALERAASSSFAAL